MNCYIHVLPGRIRIRTDLLKRNQMMAYHLKKNLSSLKGVESVLINSITGSLLIYFDVIDINTQTLLKNIAQHRVTPVIEIPENNLNSKQVIRVHVESHDMENIRHYSLLTLKKITQLVIGNLDVKSKALQFSIGILVPAIIEAIVT